MARFDSQRSSQRTRLLIRPRRRRLARLFGPPAAGRDAGTRAGSRRSRRQLARSSAKPMRRSSSRSNTKPPSEEIRPPSNVAVTFLRQTAGRSKEEGYRRSWRGVTNSLSGLKGV